MLVHATVGGHAIAACRMAGQFGDNRSNERVLHGAVTFQGDMK